MGTMIYVGTAANSTTTCLAYHDIGGASARYLTTGTPQWIRIEGNGRTFTFFRSNGGGSRTISAESHAGQHASRRLSGHTADQRQ